MSAWKADALPLGDARVLRHDSTVKVATGQADKDFSLINAP